ncbi:hypothetical protein [Aquabacterium sp. OR-4]|uniref:hypothetical protein n=1 Tax=Aquabacterium sp. OR-4 TaxID=2978127 RepID=UPI0021B2115C|nr:hypothetical protein [Aquabacterium sp. OR-4]MDT7835124.1 hypothetical protein [Aquabacterium sp. OR-4]
MGSRLWQQLQEWRHTPSRPAAAEPSDDGSPRASGELTTQPPPSRGQALREAYRTLRQRMDSRPAMRQVLPHLAAIERALGRHGSRALHKLPVPVLHRGLTQLTLLQSDDDAPLDAASLRVLRLRLIEAIALRSAPVAGSDAEADRAERPVRRALPSAPRGFAPSSHLGASTLPQGMEVSEVSADAFDEAERTLGLSRRH